MIPGEGIGRQVPWKKSYRKQKGPAIPMEGKEHKERGKKAGAYEGGEKERKERKVHLIWWVESLRRTSKVTALDEGWTTKTGFNRVWGQK